MSDLNAAITRLEASLAREGGSAASFNELGALKLAGGDAEGAIIAYSQCLTFASQNAAIYNNLGTALVKGFRHLDGPAAGRRWFGAVAARGDSDGNAQSSPRGRRTFQLFDTSTYVGTSSPRTRRSGHDTHGASLPAT